MPNLSTRQLLLSTSAFGLIIPAPAFADVTVSADSSNPLVTSADGDVVIEDDVVVEVTGANPITLNSKNTVTVEEDAEVYADDADGRSGVVIATETAGTLDNAGAIYVIEDFLPEDEDGNLRPDGQIAEASGRYGIRVLSQAGSITNSGSIYVEGLESYGISFADGWSGDFDNTDGTVSVVGDDSVGITAQSVAGDLEIGGTVSVIGVGSKSVELTGDISGTLVINGSVTKARSYTNDDGDTMSLSRSDLRDAAPAVSVTGNIAQGILIDAPPYDLDDDNDDEDGDGIDDTDETTGSITAYGESPALLVGGAQDITIGTGTGRDGSFSLAIDGTISSSAYYSSFDTAAVVIGGQGGLVDLTGGIGVSGKITATTNDSRAIALQIHEGVTATSLYNSGTIMATLSSTGEGETIAIQDLSGTLTTIDNTGYITARGSAEDETIALDLRANSSGITITQYLNDIDADTKAEEMEDDDYDASDPTIYTSINGDVLTGSGDDLLDISSGWIDGDSYLADGNDTVLLSDDAQYIGDIHSGAGAFVMSLADTATFTGSLDAAGEPAQVTLTGAASFKGGVENGDQLSITVDGGLLQAADGETMTFDKLEVGSDGAIGIVINNDDGTNSAFSVNSASFADGASVAAEITSLAETGGDYTVLTADEITGATDLDLDIGDLPLLYTAGLSSDANSITLELHRKTADELGLTGPQSAAYDAILTSAATDSYIEASLLQAEDTETLQGQMDGLLPDYAGGVFDFITRGSRLASRHISDDSAMFADWDTSIWVEGLKFQGSKDYTDTLDFKTDGYGISGGLERRLSIGYVGLSLNWMTGSIKAGTDDMQDTDASAFEFAAHWRKRTGKLYTFARTSVIRASLSSTRNFLGTISDTDFTYTTGGDWKGTGVSAMGGASYNFDLSDRITLRPKAVLDFYWLKEKGYEESGDSDAMDLVVGSRTSKSATATGSLVASYRLGRARSDETPLTIELEAGRREALAGSLGETTASFEDGEDFTLTPDALKGGWLAEARLLAGGWYHTWQIAAGAERTQGDIDLSVRASISLSF